MKRISRYIAVAVLAVLLAGCGGRKASQDNAFHPVPFPAAPTVPSIIKDGTEATEYVMDHFWDAFLGRNLPCDTNIVNGVLAGVTGKERSDRPASGDAEPAEGKAPRSGSISERKGETYITRRI